MGPEAGALLFWGVLCLGSKVTLKGFLFLSPEEQQSAILLIFWRKEKKLCLFILENYYTLCPCFYHSFGSSPCEYRLFYIFTQKVIEGKFVVLLHTDFRFIEGGRVLAFSNWKHEPRFWESRVLWSTSRDKLLTGE